MSNLKTTLIGYKKQDVDKLIMEKDSLLKTQQGDIDYLHKRINELEKQLENSNKNEPEK